MNYKGKLILFILIGMLLIVPSFKTAANDQQLVLGTKGMLDDIEGHWAGEAIRELVAEGAVSGYPDGTFRPDRAITRAEFATILVKAFQLESVQANPFADMEGHWARDAVAAAAGRGIVTGFSPDRFGPNETITREQLAAIMVRLIDAKTTKGETELLAPFTDRENISGWARGAVAAALENKIIGGYPDSTIRPLSGTTRAEAVTVIQRVKNREEIIDDGELPDELLIDVVF